MISTYVKNAPLLVLSQEDLHFIPILPESGSANIKFTSIGKSNSASQRFSIENETDESEEAKKDLLQNLKNAIGLIQRTVWL